MGVPDDMKQNFTFLGEKKIISSDLAERMEKMVGFRNIAVHEYQALKVEILKSILSNRLPELEDFYTSIVSHFRLEE